VTAAATAAATETAEGDLDVVGLTQDSRLISFQDDEPGNARDIGRINGLAGDARLVGIDYRPATGNNGSQGVLYGLGNAGGVYTIDSGARATKVSQLSVALEGSSFGVDFNPAVDRLRIISDTGRTCVTTWTCRAEPSPTAGSPTRPRLRAA
jgi:hypothetical protein